MNDIAIYVAIGAAIAMAVVLLMNKANKDKEQ